MNSKAIPSSLLRYLQPRNVALGMKPLEDFQTASLILLAAVFLLGVGRHGLERRRLVPASFDLGINKRQEHFVIVSWNRRADNVELQRLRVFNWTGRVGPAKSVQEAHRR